MRSEQLLRAMQKVSSHDLPNQMVVLQSLLRLLAEEESAGLSPEGREYVRRLQSATRRASDMVRFVKEIGRLSTFACKSAAVSLDGLARELQGELQRLYPEKRFEFDWHFETPTIVGDVRVFLQALLELFAGFLQPHADTCRVSGRSQGQGDAIEVAFEVAETSPNAAPRSNVQALEQRMEVVLASEWLALCRADVEVELAAEGLTRFSIVAPER